MRIFHGVAYPCRFVIKNSRFVVKEVAVENLRGKVIDIPKKFRNHIANVINKNINTILFANLSLFRGAKVYKFSKVHFTIGMNERGMVISVQSPTDTFKKKVGVSIVKGRLEKLYTLTPYDYYTPKWCIENYNRV